MIYDDEVLEITNRLAEMGKEKYKPEYLDKIPYWQRVGGALCGVLFGRPKETLQMAHEILEDMNAHSLCRVLAWAYPGLDQPDDMDYANFDPNKKYMLDLESVKKLIDRKNVTVLTEWNTEKSDYDIRHAKVTVNIEWLD
jgi:hypothetical protein